MRQLFRKTRRTTTALIKRTLRVSRSDRRFIPVYWKRRIRSLEALLQVEKMCPLVGVAKQNVRNCVTHERSYSDVSSVYQLVLQLHVDLLKCGNNDSSSISIKTSSVYNTAFLHAYYAQFDLKYNQRNA